MGVNIRDILIRKEISMSDLAGKKIAFDSYNILYQFLSAIRQRDGTPLMDVDGKITSHLSGIFYRTINFIEAGIKPIFVFDGMPPELKNETLDMRKKVKIDSQEKYDEAIKIGDADSARKYAQRTSRLTPSMVSEAKELIKAMGMPVVQALAEGEAQAAQMAKKAIVYAAASQDYDSVLFGAPFLIRNLSVSPKKGIKPEIIALAEVLNTYSIDIDQLIQIGILIGTDFNNGIKGIGPKKALSIVQKGESEKYLAEIPRAKQVLNLFKNPAISIGISLKWTEPDEKKIKEILCERHNFSEERIDVALSRLRKKTKDNKQTNLEFFVE